MKTEVRKCWAAEIFDDPASAELFAEYERECANPLTGSIAPMRTLYGTLERFHNAQCFAAYADGKLGGFAFVVISVVPHYGRWFATVESLFVANGARRSGLGRELMASVENHAKERDCSAIFYSAPLGSRLASLMLLSQGEYRNTNLIFTKALA